jgi:hypothetical protein
MKARSFIMTCTFFLITPLIILVIVARLLESAINADILVAINFIAVYESLAVAMAILFLIGQRNLIIKMVFFLHSHSDRFRNRRFRRSFSCC